MNLFLKRLLLFATACICFIVLFLGFIAFSSRYTNRIESHLLRYSGIGEWGSTYQRSNDLKKWQIESSAKKGLILGSSTAYRNINPYILDSFTSINWFNCASSSQSTSVSISLLEHILTKTQIDYLLFDTYAPMSLHEGNESLEDWVNNSTLPTSTKIRMIISNGNYNLRLLIKCFYLGLRKIFSSSTYYTKSEQNGKYLGKGFVYSPNRMTSVLNEKNIRLETSYNQNAYIEKIIATCKRNNIQLILHNPRIINKVQVNDLVSIAQDNDALFIEGQSIYSSNDSVNFWYYDDHHNTGLGANHNSKILAKELQKLGIR